MVWNKAGIKTFLTEMGKGELKANAFTNGVENRYLVYLMLQAMQARQTADEQACNTTAHQNGVGFNGTDAQFCGSVATSSLQYGNLTPNQARAIARSLVKYAGQLEEAYTDTCDAPEEVVAKSMSAAVSANEAPMLDWGGFQVA